MLEAIRQQLEADPGYLADPGCPYPEPLKPLLRRLVAPVTQDAIAEAMPVFAEGMGDGGEAESLIREVQNAINSMRRLQTQIDTTDDVGDKLAFFKNYGSLMDRFLSLKEKANGTKQMYDFQRVVIAVLEQVLDKDGRLEFKTRLKAANVPAASAVSL